MQVIHDIFFGPKTPSPEYTEGRSVIKLKFLPYDRRAAVEYAHRWAFGRNPEYYDFSEIGGDCTNFASQCLYAGTGIMNFTAETGWYYINPNDRTPSWTGVTYFWDFMTRKTVTPGPWGVSSGLFYLRPGDFVQLKFRDSGGIFAHTPVVVSVGYPAALNNILVAAHSNDADNRPLDTYENVEEMRFLHILGGFYEENNDNSEEQTISGSIQET